MSEPLEYNSNSLFTGIHKKMMRIDESDINCTSKVEIDMQLKRITNTVNSKGRACECYENSDLTKMKRVHVVVVHYIKIVA